MHEIIHKIKEWPREKQIVVAVGIGILLLIGIGFALRGGSGPAVGDLFGIQGPPSLTRGVSYSRELPPEVREQLEGLVAELRGKLEANISDYESWLALAIRYKQAGDYGKAREVWEYLASIHPDDVVPRHNLGDLYHHFLTDYARAEKYYKEALALSPTNSLEYLSLHELYRFNYKTETTLAEDILKEGVAKADGNQKIDLHVALATYYADKGMKAEAIAEYAAARDLARAAKNTRLVQSLDLEIAKLR